MANITYLIGAGASANALPLVSDMRNRMQFFLNFLERDKRGREIFNGSTLGFEKLLSELKDVHYGALQHATPDTYAKKLFLKRDTCRLRFLKLYLSLYFLFEQSEHGIKDFKDDLVDNLPDPLPSEDMLSEASSLYEPLIKFNTREGKLLQKILATTDSRYDVLFATLLENVSNRLILPSNVNIISWNYDLQLELSYCDFDNREKLTAIENLNIFPLSKHLNSEGGGKIIKLNGMAGLFSNDEFKTFSVFDFDLFMKEPFLALEKLIHDFEDGKKIKSFLNFAWEAEENSFSNRAIYEAQEIIMKTDALVIIGYSFPNFNKMVDRRILEGLGSSRISPKVYYQAHKDEIEGLCKSFYWLMEGKFTPEPITNLNQFFIPPEFAFPPTKGSRASEVWFSP